MGHTHTDLLRVGREPEASDEGLTDERRLFMKSLARTYTPHLYLVRVTP